MGSALPRRAEADPAERRRVLGCLARRSKGDRDARPKASGSGGRGSARSRRCGSLAPRQSARRTSIRSPQACRPAAFAMRRLPRPKAPPTSASTSSISVSSSWCRRCCSRICSSPSDWNNARARWDCSRRSGSHQPRSAARSFVKGSCSPAIGAIIGAAAAVGYGALIMYGLRTWWVGAVGTTRLELHVAPVSLAAGVAGAFAAGMLALWLGVRAMSRRSARALLKGDVEPVSKTRRIGRTGAKARRCRPHRSRSPRLASH